MRRPILAVLVCLVFSAARATAAEPQATRFAVIGDYGADGEDEASVAKLVGGWEPDFIVTVGDNNYPDGDDGTLDDNIGQYYQAFIRFNPAYRGRYASEASRMRLNRFFPALGNHDWHTADARPYLEYFSLPGNGRYYATRQGPVEVFIVDSDPSEPDGVRADSRQGLWLQAALAASQAPWKVVAFHHPPYTTGWHGPNMWMRWPFKAWGADIVLSGHDHDYERILVDDFPYIVCGLGGGDRRDFLDDPLQDVQEDVRYSDDFGALLVEATPTRLRVEFHNTLHEIIDTYTVDKSQTR